MNDFNFIKDIWQNAETPSPEDISVIISEIKKKRRQMFTKGLLGVVSLVAALSVIVWVLFGYDAKIITTRIGTIMVIIATIGGIVLNSQMLNYLWRPLEPDNDNRAYLERMKELRKKQHFMHTRGSQIYFAVLTSGLVLYMYEFTHRDIVFMLIAYGMTLAWIAFAWFYLRPRTIRRDREKLDSIIARLERISKQVEG